MVGKTLSHFRILARIGEGGMGVVYKAEDEKLHRPVALKVLPSNAVTNEERRIRFLREARAAAALAHPNIATVYEVDEAGGVVFIAMEFIEGKTLRSLIAGKPVSLREALRLGIEIAEGLASDHRARIVHRDLKPENIMVNTDGHVKILDFGLARILQADALPSTETSRMETVSEEMTERGRVLGTASYMSPEQARGQAVDSRSDLFAFGIVLYEMLTGKVPFRGPTPMDTLAAILQQAPPAPSVLNRLVSPELERIILKCLEKNPEMRYQSPREVGVDLRRLEVAGTSRASKVAVSGRERWRSIGIVAAIAGALAALLLGLNLNQWREQLLRGAAPKRIESLAVLPLANLSGDPEEEYFADGMTDALITNLAKIGALKIISRTSVMQYKGSRKSLPEIGRELNVDAVVEGSVLRSGERVRITAELIQADTDVHLWGDSYDRDLSDVLSLQTEVAWAIAQEIRVKLTPQEQKLLVASRRVNPEAQEDYLKGRYYWNKRTEDGIKKGMEYFAKAIEKEPDNGPAYAGLADSYVALSGFDYLSPKDGYPKAKAAAMKALAIDDTLAEAHCSLAMVKFYYDWEWRAAEREFNQSIQLNQSYQTAHHWFAIYLSLMGRFDEARVEFRRAQELDPLSLIISTEAGFPSLYARQVDVAIIEFRKAIQMDPYFPPAHAFLGQAYEQAGKIPEALGEFEKAMALDGGPFYVLCLAHAYALSGKRSEALKLVGKMKELSKQQYVTKVGIAEVYTALGDANRAFESLEEAFEDRATGLLWLKVDPIFDNLRRDPRFVDLLRRVGLPP